MSDSKIKALNGVRNDIDIERFGEGDLVAGINVDIDKTGKASRRKGLRNVITGTDVHSLGSAANRAFYVDVDTLYEIKRDLSTVALKSSLAIARRMSYLDVNGAVYFMNGVNSGVIVGGRVRSMGITPPPQLNILAPNGDLDTPTYGITMTYARLDGTESGAPVCSFGVISDLTNIPVSNDPDVVTKRIYITEANGEEPYLAMILRNSATKAEYDGAGSREIICTTQFKTAMPAGDVLGIYNGRLYVGVGNIIFYSDPYNFELCDMRQNYLPFASKITIIAPVGDGIFVGTETETVFLSGDDPATFQFSQVSPVGSVLGTLSYANPKFVSTGELKGLVPMWSTKGGICVGGNGGFFTELTSGRYVLPDVTSGASLYRYKSGASHFLSVFYK